MNTGAIDTSITGPTERLDTGLVPVPADRPFPWIGLIALAAAVFLSITSEMLPVGLLPEMSGALRVDESQIGLLVTWFAFTVVATSTGLAYFTRRLPRHSLVVAVLVVFALSNMLTAIAPSYEFVVVSRVIGGMAHGLFWSVVGAYAGHLVPKAQIGRAVSITVAGGTLAFIFGVPLATMAGHVLGWRLAFIVLAGLMLVGAFVVWRFLPEVKHYAGKKRSQKADAATSASKTISRWDPTAAAVTLICFITALITIGHYTFYTYITPFIVTGLGVGAQDVPTLLFAYGVAGALGLLLVGTVFGPRPQLGLVVSIVIGAVSVSVLAFTTAIMPVAFVAFSLWGLSFGALPPLLQTRLLHTASPRIRDISSAFYTTAFNVGIGGGALLGAATLDTLGLEMIPLVYVGVLVLAFILVIVSDLVVRRRTPAV